MATVAGKYEKQIDDDQKADKSKQAGTKAEADKPKKESSKGVIDAEDDEDLVSRNIRQQQQLEENVNQSWLQLITSDGLWLFIAAFLSLVSASADLFYPYMIGLVYRHLMQAIQMANATEKWSFEEVLEPIIILFSCQWLATTTNKAIVAMCKRRLSTRVRKQLFANLISQDLEFFDRGKVGEMVSRLMKDVGMLEGFLIDSPLQIIASAFKLVGCCVITCILSWKLALVNMLLIPIFGVLAVIFGHQSKKVGKHYTSTVASVSQSATELLASVRTIQAFGREKDAEIKFNKKVNEEHDVRESTGNIQIAWRCSEDVFVKVLQVVSLWYGAVLVVQGQLDIEYIIVFQMYARLLQGAISALFMNGSRVFQLYEMLRPLRKLLFATPKLFRDGITPGPSFEKGLTVKNVDFAYPNLKHFVLEDISFTVPCRSIVGVVGRSGSGKSTLLQLLLRFYDAQNGSIRLDGHDLRTLDLKWLRERFGYVSQEPVVLNASVAENIAFGAREMDFRSRELWDMVLWASKAAQAHQFIRELPNGYKTQLGANGAHLSGGQKQRIAIARALIRRPDILVLDEATSCLDPVTERQLMTGLGNLQTSDNAPWQPKIVFIIAHRMSLVRNADQILVIDKGRVVQAGTHNQLVQQGGLYAQLLASGKKDGGPPGAGGAAPDAPKLSMAPTATDAGAGVMFAPNAAAMAKAQQAQAQAQQMTPQQAQQQQMMMAQMQQQQMMLQQQQMMQAQAAMAAAQAAQQAQGGEAGPSGAQPDNGVATSPAKGAEGLKYILKWV